MNDEFKDMPRLAKWMRNIQLCCEIPVGPDGKKVSLSEAAVLLDPNHPEHDILFETVVPQLPEEARMDFLQLRGMTEHRREVEVESVRNRIMDKLFPTKQELNED